MIILNSDRSSTGNNRSRKDEVISARIKPKETPIYVLEFGNVGMSSNFVWAVRYEFKSIGVAIYCVLPLDARSAF